MKFLLALLLVFSFYFNAGSQHLKGKVLDAETNEPLENVNVFLPGQNKGTFTDSDGNFDLGLENRIKSEELISFTHISYITQKLNLKLLRDRNFIVELKIDTTKLGEINLLSRRKLRNHIKFENLPPMIKGVFASASVLADGRIYVCGGDVSNEIDPMKKAIYEKHGATLNETLRLAAMNSLSSYEGYDNSLQLYDIAKKNWQTEKTKLQKRAYHNMIYNDNRNEIYVLGGKRLSLNRRFEYLDNKIEIFDIKRDTILTDKMNPHQAVNFASFIIGDNMILMGGSVKQKNNGNKVFTTKVHLFDTKTGLWYELGNMPKAKETSGVVLNGKIYLIGGYNGELLSGIETYDLENGKWNSIGDFFEPVARPGVIHDKENIYIYYPGNLVVFNVKNGLMKEYAISFFVDEPQMFYYNNKLYLLGGYNKDEHSKEPSSRMISIDIGELKYTKIKRSKKVKGTI